MDLTELKPIVEAMIFASDEPLTDASILRVFSEEGVDKAMISECIETIKNDWIDTESNGIQLSVVAGGYQFRTKPEFAKWIRKMRASKPARLSAPALETLSIVAYRQPIVRSEIDKLRGVDSGGVLKTLLDRRLLRVVGKSGEPGQPLLYGTTKEFLETFNLENLKDLPPLRDVNELAKEYKEKMSSSDVPPSELIGIGDDKEDDKSDDTVDENMPSPADDFDDEEPTEVIKRYPLDEDVESEKKDMEALHDLEDNIKDLRRLERRMFPKVIPVVEIKGEDAKDESHDASEKFEAQSVDACSSGEDGVEKDASSTDDSLIEPTI